MIRSHTLVGNYEFISRFDEAVDRDVPEFEHRWQMYLDGAEAPPLKAGVEPTRFTLRHISSTERIYLFEMFQGQDKGLTLAAGAMSLVGVKGLQSADGKPLEVKQEFTDVGPLRVRHASKETMDQLPVDVLLELGSLAVERMSLRPS